MPMLHLALSQQPIYNTFFRRNSVFVSSVFVAAFTFSIGFDLATSAFWDAHNRGVSVWSSCWPCRDMKRRSGEIMATADFL